MTTTLSPLLRTTNDLGIGLLRQPAMVLFGPGQRGQIPRIVAEIARRVLLVTDARMATSVEFTQLVEGLTQQGVSALVYDGTEPDLPRRNVVDIVARFGSAAVEAVVGIGGGSCMDLAKVAAVVLTHGGDVRDYYGQFLVPGPGLPVITVPTTGGTGAEVTCISVVYDEDKEMKVGVASPHLEAYAAVIDPELTLTCPPGLTAAAGADALSHLIESFTGRSKNPDADQLATTLYAGKNVLADVYARTGLELLNRSLPAVVGEPGSIDARSDTLFGAYCAGMAINTAGTAGAHAIQSPIGNLTHTPHGFGISALLPYVMRFNLPTRIPEFAEIGRIMGVAAPSDPPERQAQSAIERIEAILETLGAPLDLRTLGLAPADFDFVAEQAMLATRLTANNPRQLTTESVVAILQRSYDGDRSWWQL